VNQQPKQDRLIPFKWGKNTEGPDVSYITGIKSLNTIKAKEDRGEFPKPVYLSGKCVRWWESEVIAWAKQLPRSFKDYKQRHDGDQEAA